MRATTLAAVVIGLAAACGPSSAPSGSSSPAPSGSIAGNIYFPADRLPPLAIYAVATDGSRYYTVEVIQYQTHYSMVGLRPGVYHVFATIRPTQVTGASATRTQSAARFGGAYTKFVTCGLDVSCTDHSLIDVHVLARETVQKVEPSDWYVGPDFYQLIPGGGPPVITLPAAESSYPTAARAAGYYAQLRTGARLVKDQASCPANIACVWLGAERDGTAAAYFPATAGSNQDLYACASYLFHDDTGWKDLDFQCNPVSTPFPAVGASGRLALGMGETGCINAHSAPGLTARVLVCLPEGTPVTIDQGPQYVPLSDPNADLQIEYWWHVANQGWIVHRYLRAAA